MKCILVTLVTVHCFIDVLGFSFYLGRCPNVEPARNFDIEKFLGQWFVVQKLSTFSACWTYEFVKQNNTMQLIEKRNQMVDHEDAEESGFFTGVFEIDYEEKPGTLFIQYPLRVTSKSSFIVFDTDYENYAGILTCQQILLGHTISAAIISKKPYLERKYVLQVRSKLANMGIKLEEMNVINHTGCKYYPPPIVEASPFDDLNSLESLF